MGELPRVVGLKVVSDPPRGAGPLWGLVEPLDVAKRRWVVEPGPCEEQRSRSVHTPHSTPHFHTSGLT